MEGCLKHFLFLTHAQYQQRCLTCVCLISKNVIKLYWMSLFDLQMSIWIDDVCQWHLLLYFFKFISTMFHGPISPTPSYCMLQNRWQSICNDVMFNLFYFNNVNQHDQLLRERVPCLYFLFSMGLFDNVLNKPVVGFFVQKGILK